MECNEFKLYVRTLPVFFVFVQIVGAPTGEINKKKWYPYKRIYSNEWCSEAKHRIYLQITYTSLLLLLLFYFSQWITKYTLLCPCILSLLLSWRSVVFATIPWRHTIFSGHRCNIVSSLGTHFVCVYAINAVAVPAPLSWCRYVVCYNKYKERKNAQATDYLRIGWWGFRCVNECPKRCTQKQRNKIGFPFRRVEKWWSVYYFRIGQAAACLYIYPPLFSYIYVTVGHNNA